jgi:hypothetical protein
MLMHRSTPVLELAADEGKALISRIGEVYRPEQAPTGTAVKDGRPDRQELFPWWSERSIPECRPGSREALDALGFPGPRFILNRSLGLSLSDQYLLNPAARPLNWEEVNFFDNPFSSDMGEALFGRIPEKGRLDLMSPDNATDGVLKKRWSVADGRRVLLKAGGFLQQEPFNEMIAAAVMRRLGIAHAPCSLLPGLGRLSGAVGLRRFRDPGHRACQRVADFPDSEKIQFSLLLRASYGTLRLPGNFRSAGGNGSDAGRRLPHSQYRPASE